MFNSVLYCIPRDVTIYRLVSQNSIEEGMLRCALGKLKLEQDVTGTKKGNSFHSTYFYTVYCGFIKKKKGFVQLL